MKLLKSFIKETLQWLLNESFEKFPQGVLMRLGKK